MKTMLGDMEGGRNGFAYHPVLPVAVAVGGGINSGDSLFSTKSLAPTKKVEGPGKGVVIGAPAVLTFGAKGKKLIYGVTNMDKTTIKFIDLELSKEEQDALDKAYSK